MEKQFCFNYEHYAALAELSDADRELVREAERATANANAPYSKFRVGAAARLRSGKILYGSNFESEVYPAGLCAERTLMFYAQANYADDPIETLAIASDPSERECYPCGQCRQVMVDVRYTGWHSLRLPRAGWRQNAPGLRPFPRMYRCFPVPGWTLHTGGLTRTFPDPSPQR